MVDQNLKKPYLQNQNIVGVKRYAGVFSSWIRRSRHMLIKNDGIKVPCGECRGCCTSSKFIHISPGETTTISRIPKKFLFSAPKLPKGHLVMGYDENGCCPMFNENQCTIYNFRPLTCRNYDCRIYAATDLLPNNSASTICKQVKTWKFIYPNKNEMYLHQSTRAVAQFIRMKPNCFPDGRAPDDPAQIAIVALKAYNLFMHYHKGLLVTDEEWALKIIDNVKKFDNYLKNVFCT